MNYKKIVLTGSISVGKTTTLRALKSVFDILNPMDRTIADPGPLVHFVGEAAADIFTQRPDLKRDSLEADMRIINRIMANEASIIANENVQTLVCDRSVLDVLAFANTHDGGHFDTLYENDLVRAYVKTYDRFLLFSPDGVPYKEEGVRIEGITFREKLHRTFIQLLEDMRIPYDVITGPTSARVAKVMNIILAEHYAQRQEAA